MSSMLITLEFDFGIRIDVFLDQYYVEFLCQLH